MSVITTSSCTRWMRRVPNLMEKLKIKYTLNNLLNFEDPKALDPRLYALKGPISLKHAPRAWYGKRKRHTRYRIDSQTRKQPSDYYTDICK